MPSCRIADVSDHPKRTVIKNGRYEALCHFARLFGMQNPVGTALPDIDFCAVARGMGMAADAVCSASALDAAMTRAFAASGPTLLEVTVQGAAGM